MTASGVPALPACMYLDTGAGAQNEKFYFASCPNEDAGTYLITLTITDDNSSADAAGVLSDTLSFSATMSVYNSAPAWSSYLADQTVEIYAAYTFDFTSYTDVDDTDSHTISISTTPSVTWISLVDQTQFQVDGTQTSADIGDVDVYITVTDDDSVNSGTTRSVTYIRTISVVTCVNTAPYFPSSSGDISLTVVEGDTDFTLTSATDDNSGDTLSYKIYYDLDGDGDPPDSITTADPPLTTYDSATNILSVSPTGASYIGTYTLGIIAEDDNSCTSGVGILTSSSFIFTLTISAAENSQPYFMGSLINQEVKVGETLIYFLPTYTDDDSGDTHTESGQEEGTSSLPSFVTLEDDFSLTIEPTATGDIGSYEIEIVVEDDDSNMSGE
jgi:hypothetical protein